MPLETALVHQHSPSDAKTRLFRSLFRGRHDVYPRRFESRKTGRSGYAPACGNEWIRGVCEKPRIKCTDCLHQSFLPLTDEVIRWHLSGVDPAGQPFVAGIYPMLEDESCFLLAVDFDKDGWLEDARAFMATCRAMGIPAVLERSRSGCGGHVWFFFEEAITAAAARRLGSFVLTETMECWPDLGFGSYDRLFPNQDTLPHGGFGNLIALPLQKQPRDMGNSVFLDDQLVPYADQWAFLSSVPRMERIAIEDLVRDAERRGRVVEASLFGSEPGRLAPHIYRSEEIVDLLAAARTLGPSSSLRPFTFETLFGLMASTGMRVSEAIHLRDADVDLKRGMLTIRQTKFAKSRQLPIHPSTVTALARYRRQRERHVPTRVDMPFLVSSRGSRLGLPLGQRQAHRVFSDLRDDLGWVNRGGHDAPRLHDLRHTFVVRRLMHWYAEGADVDRMMLALSTYLGHAEIFYTYWYLTAVPELMVIAADKFEQYADLGGGDDA